MTDVAPIRIDVVERDNGVLIAKVIGDAGLPNVDLLAREMTMLSARKPAVTIFDMSELVFACSLAIGSLIQFHLGVRNHGGSAFFCSFDELLMTAINKANLHMVLNIHESVDDALALVCPTNN